MIGVLCAVQVDLTRVELEEVLPSATIMVVTVTASTTAGQPLSEAGIAAVRAHRQLTCLVAALCWVVSANHMTV